ncbi:MAG: glycosyltransferase [Steroidobacteraceae bacterium]|nr:glycosyltransferase [Deltaproteobacteria bacterium]
MNDGPLVSICVPTYNSSAYLRRSLDSIAAQTYENAEVIVGDNASTDDTVSIANEYSVKYGFKVIVNDKNIGPLNNWNMLIGQAQGDLIAIYHSDDVYEPTIVEESVQVFRNNENIAVVGTMARVVDGNENKMYDYVLPDEIVRLDKDVYSFDDVMLGICKSGGQKTFFVTPSLMVKKNVYSEVGLFDARFRSAGDYEMWFRLSVNHKVAVLNKQLINYRIHENQGSELELRRNVELPDILTVVREYRQHITQNSIRELCDRFLDERILKAALKQNWQGAFDKSATTAKLAETGSYQALRVFLRIANGLHIKLKL